MSSRSFHTIDILIKKALFSKPEEYVHARKTIYSLARTHNINLTSTVDLYEAFSQNKISGITVPAINIRTLTFDFAQRIFKLIKKYSIGIVIFEIAASEQEYTFQTPEEYAVTILAAALAEQYEGPVFIQGDHYQAHKNIYITDKNREIQRLKNLIKSSINAGFFNIDIDASTLVDLGKTSHDLQQRDNYELTAILTDYIRQLELEKETVISIGAEIGHIGGKNSTVEDFNAFMKGYFNIISASRLRGISKISVQTGSSHGGTLQSDGRLAPVTLDFNVLDQIGKIGKTTYGLGGAVQHGASTLDKKNFDQFPLHHTVEVHLSTDFQNIFFENVEKELQQRMYNWTIKHLIQEKDPLHSQEQFIYKNRKKALGPFKKNIWFMSDKSKEPILDALESECELIFRKLNITNTKNIITKYI